MRSSWNTTVVIANTHYVTWRRKHCKNKLANQDIRCLHCIVGELAISKKYFQNICHIQTFQIWKPCTLLQIAALIQVWINEQCKAHSCFWLDRVTVSLWVSVMQWGEAWGKRGNRVEGVFVYLQGAMLWYSQCNEPQSTEPPLLLMVRGHSCQSKTNRSTSRTDTSLELWHFNISEMTAYVFLFCQPHCIISQGCPMCCSRSTR